MTDKLKKWYIMALHDALPLGVAFRFLDSIKHRNSTVASKRRPAPPTNAAIRSVILFDLPVRTCQQL